MPRKLNSSKVIAISFITSALLHLPVTGFIVSYDFFKQQSNEKENLSFSINLKQSNRPIVGVEEKEPHLDSKTTKELVAEQKAVPPTKNKEAIPKPKPKQKPKQKPKVTPLPILKEIELGGPSTYRSGDEAASNNQIDDSITRNVVEEEYLESENTAINELMEKAEEVDSLQSSLEAQSVPAKQKLEKGAEEKLARGAITTRGISGYSFNTLGGQDEHSSRFKAPKGASDHRFEGSKTDNDELGEFDSEPSEIDFEGASNIDNFFGLQPLTDEALAGTKILQPYSNNFAQRYKQINVYFQAISAQLKPLWNSQLNRYTPPGPRLCKVVIEISPAGRLTYIRMKESSGDKRYDDMIVALLKSVKQFARPTRDGKFVSSGPIGITFPYRQHEEFELMPFEMDEHQNKSLTDKKAQPNSDTSEAEKYSISNI